MWLRLGGVATPTQKEMSSYVGRVVENLCVYFGPVDAAQFQWDCLWASGGLSVASQHLVKSGWPWGTGWYCCGCGMVLSFQPSYWSIESINLTLLALAATPLCTLLSILCFTDVWHVVLVPIALTQLLYYLNERGRGQKPPTRPWVIRGGRGPR